ncbi:MAG: hypothetical protein WC516_03070 [Patescibacteria group bacterium]
MSETTNTTSTVTPPNEQPINLKHSIAVSVCGIIAMYLCGGPLWMVTAFIILLATGNFFLTTIEKPSALKRYFWMYSRVGVTIALAGLITVMTDVLLGVPILQVVGWAVAGKHAANVPVWVVMEILIIVASGYASYAIMYPPKEGGRARGFAGVVVALLLVLSLWQTKAPANPIGRWVNAQLTVGMQKVDAAASEVEARIKPTWAVSLKPVRLYQEDEDGRFQRVTTSQGQLASVPEGQLVQLVGEVRKDDAGPMRRIRLMDTTGDYRNGPMFWVDADPALFKRGVDPERMLGH